MASTPLLGLSLPADGTTNWGTLVNASITALLDSAVAGTTTLSSDADVTLTATTEATNEARQAILLCTGARTAIRTITAPAQSKTYVVINATTGNQAVKIVGAGPTTGVTVPNGKVFMVAWNGSDFVAIGGGVVNLATDVTGTLPIANGGTGQTSYTNGQLLIGNSSGNTLTKATLTAGSGVTITNGNGSISISATGSGGTVTSVTGTAPVASTGGTTPAISLSAGYGDTQNPYASKTANYVLAAPNGSAGAPTFRALVAADIPTLNQNTTGNAATATSIAGGAANRVPYQTGAGATSFVAAPTTANTMLRYNGTNIDWGVVTTFTTDITVDSNITVGRGAGTGAYSTALGYQPLLLSGSGDYNTGVGYRAAASATNKSGNTAFGSSALEFVNASYNTAIGYQALLGSAVVANNTGQFNTAVGRNAGYGITSGQDNVFVGDIAGYYVTSGGQNVFVGTAAGNTANGTGNICVGHNTNLNTSGDNYSIVIGVSGSTGKGSSTGFINPDGGGVYQGNNASSWATTSDIRLKKNINDLPSVLNKILTVRVRSFEYRAKEEVTDLPKENAIKKFGEQVGVVAQELQAVFPDCVKEESTGVLSVDASNINWYLVKAIQELTARLEALEAK